MTCRKTKTMFYRFFALVALVAVAVLSWIALSFVFAEKVYAETQSAHDQVFGNDHASATAISSAGELVSSDNNLSSGNYYLTADVVLPQNIELLQSPTVKFCLHGHSMTISRGYVFEVFSGATLEIYDCGGDDDNCGKITGKGIRVFGGTFNMYGGTIRDAYANYGSGGGVTVSGGGVFNMYDGIITGNSASGNGGGGVLIGSSGSTFNMYGGTISNNTVTNISGGAGVLVSDATAVFHMYGGSITNNVIDYGTGNEEETITKFYRGAGVYVYGGTFTLEGDVNISGNLRGNDEEKVANNLDLYRSSSYEGKIDITGKLGDNTRIGVTMPLGAFTTGYYAKGNTKNPSEYFTSDNGLSIGYDDTGKECAVTSGSDVGGYKMTGATVTGATAATVGDTEVTFTVEVTLENTINSTTKTIIDNVKVNLESPLHGGKNAVSFDYKYNGVNGEQTEHLTYDIEPAKLHVNVLWYCSGAFVDGYNTARRNYDGSDILSLVTATYTDHNGEQKQFHGSWTTNEILVTDEVGNSVNSAAGVGTYKFRLAPFDDYEFDNNLFTVRVLGSADDGYYQMQDARVIGVMGSPTAGDKSFTVIIERDLTHTKDQPDKTDRVNYSITLTDALHVGENTVDFEYKYTDMGGGVQVKQLSVTVTAVKKNVTVTWYFYDFIAEGNTAKHVFDGVDASKNLVAVYDGIDGSKQRVDATSALMLKKDADGNDVTSLSNVGEYTLYLADSDDYTFNNNLFTYTVVEELDDIVDLVYQESGITILGVSCVNGFASGTELAVQKTDCDPSVVDGIIKTAYNVKFVKDSVEVTPSGGVTVYVLVPDELRGGEKYKIYNLSNGIATEVEYATEGNYAIFDSAELTCILFVTPKNAAPPNDDPVDDPIDDPTHSGGNSGNNGKSDNSGFIWLGVALALFAVGVVAYILTRKYMAKRNKSAATVSKGETAGQDEPEQKKTKTCSSCGSENDDDAQFCLECGKKFE